MNGPLKAMSLASVISEDEPPRRARRLIRERRLVLEPFIVTVLRCLLTTTLRDVAQRRLERRCGRGHAGDAAVRR